MKNTENIIIIGGGLSGLTLAYLLSKKNRSTTILEASSKYKKPFWRENGYSVMLYSHAGIVTEMYDHTNFEEDKLTHNLKTMSSLSKLINYLRHSLRTVKVITKNLITLDLI